MKNIKNILTISTNEEKMKLKNFKQILEFVILTELLKSSGF